MSVISSLFYELSSYTFLTIYIDTSDDWPIEVRIKNNHGVSIPVCLKCIDEFTENEVIRKFCIDGISGDRAIEISGNIKINFINKKYFKALRFNYEKRHLIVKPKSALELIRLKPVLNAVFNQLISERIDLPKRVADLTRHVKWIRQRRVKEDLSTDTHDVIGDQRFTKYEPVDVELAAFYEK